MTIIRVEYQGVKYDLDVLEQTPIRVDISAIENSSIGEVFGAASQSFTLPGSRKNNRFFKHAYKVGVTGVPGLGESVPCWVISKSDTLIEGSLFLDEVVKTPAGGYNYQVTIVNNVVTFNELIKTVAVKDLDWDSYDHSFTTANITGSWSDNLFSGDIFYPLIDMGTDGTETTGSMPNVAITNDGTITQGFINNSSTPLQVRQFTPAIRVSTVLDKIFDYGEFSYSSSLSPLFDSLYILPKQTEDLSVKGAGFTSFGFEAQKVADQFVTHATGYNALTFPTELSDPTNSYNTSTSVYTVPRVGTYSFKSTLRYQIDPEDVSPTLTARIRNITDGVTLGSTTVYPTTIQGTFNVETDNVNLFSGTEVRVELLYNQGTGASALDVTIESNSFFNTVNTPLNYETGTIKIGEQFEPQTRCIDILQGLIQKLNLVIEPIYTENRTLKIETYSTWVDSGKTVDWTQKIEQADRITLRSPLSSQQKSLTFEDNKDNDKLSKQVIDNAEGLQWGTEVVDAVSDVPQGEKKLGTYFSPVVLERMAGGDADNVIPQLYKTDNSEIGKKTFKFKPRLGYKINNTLPQTAYIGNNTDEFINYATISNYNTIPVVSGSTRNLHYNESFYPPTFDTSQTGSITSYQNYWDSYINSLYDLDTKILNAQIKFEPNELANIELNDRIFVEDAYYRINKIRGFNVNQNDVVDIELISILGPVATPYIPNCTFDFTAIGTTTTTAPPTTTTTSTTSTTTSTTTTSTTTTSTTTTSTTTSTTTTTTAAPNNVNLTVNNNTSQAFTSSVNFVEFRTIQDGDLLDISPVPIGTSVASSGWTTSGNKDFRAGINVANHTFGTISVTGSLYLDGGFECASSASISSSLTGEYTMDLCNVNTNLYTSYSMQVELNAFPTTTTTTASPNKFIEITTINNTSTVFDGANTYNLLDFQQAGIPIYTLRQGTPITTGTNYTSSFETISGTYTLFNGNNHLTGSPDYGTMEITSSLYLDNNLYSQWSSSVTSPTTFEGFNFAEDLNTNLYTSYSVITEYNP